MKLYPDTIYAAQLSLNFLEIPIELGMNLGGSLQESINDIFLLRLEHDFDLLQLGVCLFVQGSLGR